MAAKAPSVSDMEQKVILITGASRGIGKCTSLALAHKGYKVYATMRNPPGEEVERYPAGGFLKTLRMDVTIQEEIDAAVARILNEEERIDVLLNNAGYGLYAPVELATEEEVQQVFAVNVFGVLRLIRAVLPSMRERKQGHIINISSIAGIVSNPGVGVYCATKHALEALSASLAATVFPWGIKVTVVEPGTTATEFADVMPVGERLAGTNPYQNFTTKHLDQMREAVKDGQDPHEIADLIAKIVETTHPDFRYQTSARLQETAKKFVVDPSGNDWLKQQIDKFSDWY